MHPNQFAYKKNSSTETALHELIAGIERAYDKMQHTIVVFMDVASAFNNARITSMTNALIRKGAGYEIVRWVKKTHES